MENYLIDNLDRGILEALMGNARTAYAELAKQFGVSPGTIQIIFHRIFLCGLMIHSILAFFFNESKVCEAFY